MVSGPDKNGLYQFKNGAKAKKLPNGQYRIVKGAPKNFLTKITSRGKGSRKKDPKKIKQMYRDELFNLYSKAHLKAAKGNIKSAIRRMKIDASKKNKTVLNYDNRKVRHLIRRRPKLLTKVDIKNFDDNAPKIKTRKGVERSFIRRKITEYEKNMVS